MPFIKSDQEIVTEFERIVELWADAVKRAEEDAEFARENLRDAQARLRAAQERLDESSTGKAPSPALLEADVDSALRAS
jgi:hypothetical protein